MLPLVLKLALSPVLALQAVRVRRRLPRLPEARGGRHGVAGRGALLLRLLVVGDSSAAGVGVDRQSQALAAPMAGDLAAAIGGAVAWQLVAQSGLTTAQLHERLRRKVADGALAWVPDVVLCVSGVNDVVDQVPSQQAVTARDALANWLRNAVGARHVVFAPLPPVHQFPGLPQPLRWVAGADARRHDRALRRWAHGRADVSTADLGLRLHAGVMARDGVHPGEPAYRACASRLARHIAVEVWPHLDAIPSTEKPA